MAWLFNKLCFKIQTNKSNFIRKDYQINKTKQNNNLDLVVTYNNVSIQQSVFPNQCIVDAANVGSCIVNPLIPSILKHLIDYCFESLNLANNANVFNSINNDDMYLSYYNYLNINHPNQPPNIKTKFNNYSPKFSFKNNKITIPNNLSQYIAYRIYSKFYKNLYLIKDNNNVKILQFKTVNYTIEFKDILKTITLYDLVPFVIETILDKINSTNVIIVLHRFSTINNTHINDDCTFSSCDCLQDLNNDNTVNTNCNHSLKVHFNFGNFHQYIQNIQNINLNKIQIIQSNYKDDDYTIIQHSNFFAFLANENNKLDYTNIKCYRPNPAPPIENGSTKTFNKYLYGRPVLSNLYEYGILTNKLATHIPLSYLCPIIISNDNYNNQPEPENCKNINKINICKYDIKFNDSNELDIIPIIHDSIFLVMRLYNIYIHHLNFINQFLYYCYINSSNIVNHQLNYVDPSISNQTNQFHRSRSYNNPQHDQHHSSTPNNNIDISHSPKQKYFNKNNNQNTEQTNSLPPNYTQLNYNNDDDEIDIDLFAQNITPLLSNHSKPKPAKKSIIFQNRKNVN